MALRIITANRLGDGFVVYRAPGGRWTERLAEAEAADSDAAEARLLAAAEQAVAARLVVGPYAVAVERDGDTLKPLSQRERIRAQGPTVRLDFCRPATGDVSREPSSCMSTTTLTAHW